MLAKNEVGTYNEREGIRVGELAMTKLTLSVDEAVVERAKEIAQANGTSVSAMFSRFVKSMDSPIPKDFKIGPLTRKATGIAKLPPGKDYKEALADALAEKYGID